LKTLQDISAYFILAILYRLRDIVHDIGKKSHKLFLPPPCIGVSNEVTIGI